jgi:hypothetical protein
MLTIESKTGRSNGNPEAVYNYVSDFTNFSDLEVSADRIAFDIQGLGHVGLEIREKTPFSAVVVGASKDSSADFTFTLRMADAGPGSDVSLVLVANLNMFLEMMARNPLQQLADLMVDKLAAVDFNSR